MLKGNNFNLKEYENKIHFMTITQLMEEWDLVVGKLKVYYEEGRKEKYKAKQRNQISSGIRF